MKVYEEITKLNNKSIGNFKLTVFEERIDILIKCVDVMENKIDALIYNQERMMRMIEEDY